MTKKKLPVLGKSLMPEVLPDPLRTKDAAGSSARERVRERLRQIKDSATALAAAAAIAACGDDGSGGGKYGVVDPLPPPAGSGGWRPPPQCGGGQQLDPMTASALWRSKTRIVFMISPSMSTPAGTVRLSQIISNAGSASDISAGAIPFAIELESKPWPEHTYLKLATLCENVTGETLTFDIDASNPMDSGSVPITLRAPGDEDAGTP